MTNTSFYAVRGGPTPGVYTSWDAALKHGAQGIAGATCKKFKTHAEALAHIQGTGGPAPASASSYTSLPKAHRGGSGSRPTLQASTSSSASSSAAILTGELALFTDGACKGNNHVGTTVCPAGWGVAVVDNVPAGTTGEAGGELIEQLFAPVVLDSGSPFFLDAETGSNNTGELSAIVEALLWLRDDEPSGRDAVICYDSEYAANQTQGLWKANKNQALVRRAQTTLGHVRGKGRRVRFVHVKGHSAHRWNDLADALANQGAAGQRCTAGRWRRPLPAQSGDPHASASRTQQDSASLKRPRSTDASLASATLCVVCGTRLLQSCAAMKLQNGNLCADCMGACGE